MLGVRSAQRGLLEADHLYLDYVGRESFYGFLASMRGQLFQDEEFAELYCPDNGRVLPHCRVRVQAGGAAAPEPMTGYNCGAFQSWAVSAFHSWARPIPYPFNAWHFFDFGNALNAFACSVRGNVTVVGNPTPLFESRVEDRLPSC